MRGNKIIKIIAVVVFIMISISMLYSFSKELGRIEWTEKGPIVIAKGIGAVNPQMSLAVQRPAVIEAAKVVALRNAIEIIKGVNLNSETTIENHMLTNDIIIKNVEGMIKTYEVGEPHYFSDGTVEIEVKIPLYENPELMREILPMDKIGKEDIKPIKKDTKVEDYTGLIVDCRGLELMPALTVKIYDENGNVVYSESKIDGDYLFKMEGMVVYVNSEKEAKDLKDRIGTNPLMVKAKGIKGKLKTDVIISNSDAEKLLASPKSVEALKQCRVVFIVDNF